MDSNTRNTLIVGTSIFVLALGLSYYFNNKKDKSEFEGEGNVDSKSKKSNKIKFVR